MLRLVPESVMIGALSKVTGVERVLRQFVQLKRNRM